MQRRGVVAGSVGAPPSHEQMVAMLWANMLTPDEQAERAGPGDTPCDIRPEGLPAECSCCFKKGHAVPCRFFGDVMGGLLGDDDDGADGG